LVRVGFGTDSHRFDESGTKPLILGGVRIEEGPGLLANSDGDVLLHALFNALSQACGGHSLGHYADPLLRRGITDSSVYLGIALNMVDGMGMRVFNTGIMVEAARPRIPIETVERMKGSVAGLLGTAQENVGITFTSGEGLTAFGRGDGILAQAVVSLVENTAP
jgi:2-C-methyl-D-erythritol 2,4-cyclodiphosphate synthase